MHKHTCRRPELYMMDLCEKRGIPIIAYGTLVGVPDCTGANAKSL